MRITYTHGALWVGGFKGEILKINPKTGNPMRWERGDPLPLEIDFALLWSVETIDAVHYTSLSRAIGSDYGEDFTLFNLETHPAESLNPSKAKREVFNL